MIARISFFLFALFSIAACTSSSQKSEKYRIGRDSTWYPLHLNSNGIKMIGFTNALISEIAKEQKTPFNIVEVGWINLFQGLEEQTYPAIFSPLSVNQITTSKYSFSEPIIYLGPVLIVREDSSATSLADLSGKIVGTSTFSDGALIIQPYSSILIQLYDNMPQALEDLSQERIDAVLLDSLEAHSLIPTWFAGQLKIVSKPLNDKALRVVTLKDKQKDLLSRFNKGLADLKSSGKYESLRKEFKLN